MFFCTWRLFSTVPSSFVPAEDQGYILVAAILPDGASLDRAENVCDRVSEIFTKEPEVKDAPTFAGYSLLDINSRRGRNVIRITEGFDERNRAENSAFSLIDRLRSKLAFIKEATVIPVDSRSWCPRRF
jgi:multidrug efflux pump